MTHGFAAADRDEPAPLWMPGKRASASDSFALKAKRLDRVRSRFVQDLSTSAADLIPSGWRQGASLGAFKQGDSHPSDWRSSAEAAGYKGDRSFCPPQAEAAGYYVFGARYPEALTSWKRCDYDDLIFCIVGSHMRPAESNLRPTAREVGELMTLDSKGRVLQPNVVRDYLSEAASPPHPVPLDTRQAPG